MPVRTYLTLLTLVAAACTAPSAEFPPVARLHNVLVDAVKGGPGTIVSLDTVIAGDWEALYVFSPYTGSSHIRECVGARVPTRGIEANDGITLLVLAPTKGAPLSIAIPGDVSFAPEATSRAYTRGSVSFVVQEPRPQSWGHFIPASGSTRSCWDTAWRSNLSSGEHRGEMAPAV